MALGFSPSLPWAASRAACAGSASASQPYGESGSGECSRHPLSLTSRKSPSPAVVPRSLPARCRRARGRLRSVRLGSAGVGALAESAAPGAAPTARRVRARGLCQHGALDLEWGTKSSRAEFSTASSLCLQKAQSNLHLGSVKDNISSTYINSHTDSLLELVRLANTKNLKSGLYYKKRSLQAK